jgi:CHAT domain-containing protein
MSSSAPFEGVLAVRDPSLSNTLPELAIIKEHASMSGFRRLDGNEATPAAVLQAMAESHWVHFACHASQNLADPLKSAFKLHDGDLDLEAIMRKSLGNRGLAFLSACQTATGDPKLSEEAVHLAAGMLSAGYCSVIATMWSIQDEDAPLVSDEVYSRLFDVKAGEAPDASKSAWLFMRPPLS